MTALSQGRNDRPDGPRTIVHIMARIIALDLGSVRTGVAVSDPTRTIATPMKILVGDANDAGFAERIRDLVAAHDVERVIVGIPRSLNGKLGPMAHWAEGIRRHLTTELSVPVDVWDERFSSDEAARRMRNSGTSSRNVRGQLDSAAAAVILQEYLEAQRSGETPEAGAAPLR